ncbi:small integral membrane protein 38 [Sphaerodactylus townsendi]|uniref:small integral membrane protein 38 n=1 Tax=Sphaerodactylus townsendi TaxID=933632 RepID=UPI0020274CAF|nr:small integral membrane protein 38 [Sphaerodactylus townsendi]
MTEKYLFSSLSNYSGLNMGSNPLMILVVIIILMRFILWSCFSAYLDYKLSQRFPEKRKDS